MIFAVEIRIGEQWENVWHDGDDVPATFATREEAEAALRAHFESMRYACMEFNPQDYRIVEVQQ